MSGIAEPNYEQIVAVFSVMFVFKSLMVLLFGLIWGLSLNNATRRGKFIYVTISVGLLALCVHVVLLDWNLLIMGISGQRVLAFTANYHNTFHNLFFVFVLLSGYLALILDKWQNRGIN